MLRLSRPPLSLRGSTVSPRISLFLSLSKKNVDIYSSLSSSYCHWPHCHGPLPPTSPLVSSTSPCLVSIHVCSDVPIWDSDRTFLWQCHSHSALWPDPQSHQARIRSGVFRICGDIPAERFRGETTASDQLNGEIFSPTSVEISPPESCPWLLFVFNLQIPQQTECSLLSKCLRASVNIGGDIWQTR